VKFSCPCQEEVADITKLQEHKKRCQKMSEKYGGFYDAWDQIVDSAITDENLDEWRNVRAMYEYFRG
jgi:hypothetical protein